MNSCKICGNLLEGFERIGVCPACAIARVLEGETDYSSEPIDFAQARLSPLIGRLPICENFFDKYQILEVIDDGGQGRVWMIWDYDFRRELAMKGLSEEMSTSQSACYRFLAEAQITSQLKHPGILSVYDAGLDLEGKPFYTKELCNGVRLDGRFSQLKQGAWTRPNLNSALGIIARVCEIVGHVHSRGVIHRDLKPANILAGEFGEVHVVDWGSAAVLKHNAV
jgi:serine/threonine-protein kinase